MIKVYNKAAFCHGFYLTLRKLVKTIVHARDPLFGGQGKEETMGLPS